jgi:UDPglucose 6-dehydrogenase
VAKTHGAIVKTADPKVEADFQDPYAAIKDAHVVMLLVEWDEYIGLDLTKVASLMHEPKYFFDTRNQYHPHDAIAAGLHYKGIGR